MGKFADNLFYDLEIAGGSGWAAGQKGIRLARHASAEILAENTFDRIVIHEVDRPIEHKDSEGNYWTRTTIDGFCYTPGAAIDAQGLANVYGARVAVVSAAGSFAFRNTGGRCRADLIVDMALTQPRSIWLRRSTTS